MDIYNTSYKSEYDDEDNDNAFEGPFDPNNIDVDISVVNLGSLLEMLEYGEIDLSPDFQRESDLWSIKQKSRLIESVLLGLPLPSFYFSEDPNTKKLVVVDGLQRLCAFNDFWIKKTLRLEGMQFLTNLNGKSIKDLDRTQIRRIKSLKITLNSLRKETPTNVKYVLFQRINTAGLPLSQQEMRNALYQGKATDLLKRMVTLASFEDVIGYRLDKRRMTDCYFANRFLAFHLNKDKYNGDINSFMGDVLAQVNQMNDKDIDSIKESFDRAMIVCYAVFGKEAFVRYSIKKSKNNKFKYKLSRPLFDALSVSIANLTAQQQNMLVERKSVFNNIIQSQLQEGDFIKSITSNATTTSDVKLRFSIISNAINDVLNNDY